MSEIDKLTKIMEEFANSPKEPIGTREPGEYNMYELQNYFNSVERIFINNGLQVSENTLEDLVKIYKKGYSLVNRNRGKGL